MTAHRKPPYILTFHRSGPMVCPYLPDRVEQQLFHELNGPDSQDVFDHLSANGFRRSHHIVYRPACPGCEKCIPVRFPVKELREGKAFRRILNRNAEVSVSEVGAHATAEQYALFRAYVKARHSDGDMAQMSYTDFSNLVVASPVDTTIFEWRDPSGKLIGACISDRLKDGLSAVYSFFDPTIDAGRSLGTYIILSLSRVAAAAEQDYIYLGFWVPGSPKMDYKRRFEPLEAFGTDGWKAIDRKAQPTSAGE